MSTRSIDNSGTNRLLIILGTVAAAFIVAATSWNFAAVAEMPEKYVTKEENRADHTEIKEQLDEIRGLIINLHVKGDKDNE